MLGSQQAAPSDDEQQSVALIGRLWLVAVPADSMRLPLAAEDGTAGDVVSDGIDHRHLSSVCRGRRGDRDQVAARHTGEGTDGR